MYVYIYIYLNIITLVLGVILFHLYLYNITVSWAITLRFPTLMFVDQGVSSLSSAAQLCTADQGGLWWPYCGYGPACVRGTKKRWSTHGSFGVSLSHGELCWKISISWIYSNL